MSDPRTGASPVATRTVLVDFDGTLFPWDELFADNPPIPGAVEGMKALKAAGYKVHIHSSRLSYYYLNKSKEDAGKHLAHIKAMCEKWDIPYEGITGDKRPAVAYIDDNAYRLTCWPDKENPVSSNWEAVVHAITHEHEWFIGADDANWKYCYDCPETRRVEEGDADLPVEKFVPPFD